MDDGGRIGDAFMSYDAMEAKTSSGTERRRGSMPPVDDAPDELPESTDPSRGFWSIGGGFLLEIRKGERKDVSRSVGLGRSAEKSAR